VGGLRGSLVFEPIICFRWKRVAGLRGRPVVVPMWQPVGVVGPLGRGCGVRGMRKI
jgi:hypothetical protein